MRIRIHSLTLLHPHGFDCLSCVLLPLAQALRGFGQGDPIKNQIHVVNPPFKILVAICFYKLFPSFDFGIDYETDSA